MCLNFLNNCVCLQMYGLAPVEHTKNLTMLTPILVAGRPQRPTTSDDATSYNGIREVQNYNRWTWFDGGLSAR